MPEFLPPSWWQLALGFSAVGTGLLLAFTAWWDRKARRKRCDRPCSEALGSFLATLDEALKEHNKFSSESIVRLSELLRNMDGKLDEIQRVQIDIIRNGRGWK